MLAKMVLSVECTLVKLSFLAGSVVVALDVGVVRVDDSTEDAADLVGLGIEGAGAFGTTNPPL